MKVLKVNIALNVALLIVPLFVLLPSVFYTLKANANEQIIIPYQPCEPQECEADPHLIEIIKKRLDFYNKSIPQIYFIHLPNHDDWIGSIMALEMLLGYQSTSLDFEHPPELSQDLLYVTVARIQKMLLYGHSAAFLFKVGVQALSKKDITCVITMNPDVIAKNSQTANSYMLALSEDMLKKMSPPSHLDGINLLEFIIDHEVAHCLDSHYNGPNPMSMKDYWGQYMHYQREIFADTFAMASHINQNDTNSPFIDNFIKFRQLCLINGDPGCCSADALTKLQKSSPHQIINQDIKQGINDNTKESIDKQIKERIELATKIRKNLKISYEKFETYYFASIEAMKRMNIDPDEHYKEVQLPEDKILDEDLVQQLINQTRKTYHLLFQEELEVKTNSGNTTNTTP